MKITRRLGLQIAGAATLAIPIRAFAEGHATVHEVQMLNKDPDTGERQVFYPAVLAIAVGDTVNFVPTDKGHNSTSTKNLIPDGAEAWRGKLNNEISVTFDTPGVYGYHCTPHQSTGMVGMILVGDVTQEMLDAAGEVRQRGKAKARFAEYLETASEMIAGS